MKIYRWVVYQDLKIDNFNIFNDVASVGSFVTSFLQRPKFGKV